jgi:FKBP12-rapamycin complex-associated protein
VQNVHRLILEPAEDLDNWLELVTLTHQNDMLLLCENILKRLGAPLASAAETQSNPDSMKLKPPPHPRVMYNSYKFLWAKGERTRAMSGLSEFLSSFPLVPMDPETRTMKVKCLLKKALWTRTIMDSAAETSMEGNVLKDVLEMVREARDLASDQYSVWHAWAVTNFEQLQLTESRLASLNATSSDQSSNAALKERLRGLRVKDDQADKRKKDKSGHRRTQSFDSLKSAVSSAEIESMEETCSVLVVEAVKGFVRSIILSRDQPVANILQDTLRLLTLWFSFGTRKNVFSVLNSELENVPPESWLGVVPQLIARMHVRVPEIAGPLRRLLMKVSAAHPQALVPPVSVALNTTDVQRKNLATDVIAAIRKSDFRLVEEATMVSKELMRVAISAHEFWHEGLERAAHFYIVEKDVSGMLSVLEQLHGQEDDSSRKESQQQLPTSPVFSSAGWRGSGNRAVAENTSTLTLLDLSFQNNFGRDLSKAYTWLMKFKSSSSNLFLLHQAWSIYHDVFRRIAAQLKNFKHIELAHVSTALTSASGLCLAVPGTYKPFEDVIRVVKFAASVDVISSKQRPRRMTITGSDGSKYRFLLKGHEDLRQDERVMQLFGLINACLANNRSTNRLDLKIVRYSVLPLSNNSGLIGWVENCDTLNQLVKMYRESVDIKLNVEHRLLMTKAPNYEKLPLIQKIGAFKQVYDETQGIDIAKMLWLKSKTSDIWIERRTNYTKSLALTSMAGYILGLGDRHPSNLMLDRVSGKIIHIDFGDCFEVAMNRSKFPETVPFRLTRMLVKAMEISGIEGTYRTSCHKVLRRR